MPRTKLTPEQKEDRLIRTALIGAASAAVLGVLVVLTTIAAMVSYNYNFLEWME